MISQLFILLFSPFVASQSYRSFDSVNTESGTLRYGEDWGYVDVRKDAHTFWWLYATTTSIERPLFLWLQGGPGAPSTDFGNFELHGPKRMNGSDNEFTWLQMADMVYLDSPVGTGFSYVDNSSALTTNVQQIGEDLMTWLRGFLLVHPEYINRSFYVFGESYGGKVATEFAGQITEAIKQSKLKLNFRAVVLGDAWINPVDHVTNWAPFLHAHSFLDGIQLEKFNNLTTFCEDSFNSGRYEEAAQCLRFTQTKIATESPGVSFYNVRKYHSEDEFSMRKRRSAPGDSEFFMNTIVRKKLAIIPDYVLFQSFNYEVYNAQNGDFWNPVHETVDQLLKDGHNVVVYTGADDLICSSLGAEKWLNRLTWSGKTDFDLAPRAYFQTPRDRLAGFVKSYRNLSVWSILHAGHMLRQNRNATKVPHDAPQSAHFMVYNIIRTYDN